MTQTDNKPATFDEFKKTILNDFSISGWLKRAIAVLDARDVGDVLDDVELLKKLFEMKWDEIFKQASNK